MRRFCLPFPFSAPSQKAYQAQYNADGWFSVRLSGLAQESSADQSVIRIFDEADLSVLNGVDGFFVTTAFSSLRQRRGLCANLNNATQGSADLKVPFSSTTTSSTDQGGGSASAQALAPPLNSGALSESARSKHSGLPVEGKTSLWSAVQRQ